MARTIWAQASANGLQKMAYLFILHAWLNCDLQCLRLSRKLDVGTLLAFLSLELLEHAWSQLLCDHLLLAVTLSLALGRLYDILVPCDLKTTFSA